MSKIQVNEIVNHFDTGAPDCPKGLTVTGFSTFTGSSSFSGDVSIGGTLTYEDVTNIDSVGVVTARSGLDVGVGGTVLTTTESGNIGINRDTNILSKLHVRESTVSGRTTVLTLEAPGTAADDGPAIDFIPNGSSVPSSSIVGARPDAAGTDGYLSFYTNDASTNQERIRIDSSGQLLIGGVNSGQTNTKLRVSGDIEVESSNSADLVGKVRCISNNITNLGTGAVSLDAAPSMNAGCFVICITNQDGDDGTFMITTGKHSGVAHKYNLISGSNSNCNVAKSGTHGNVYTITSLGDGRTYTLTFSTTSAHNAPTIQADASTSGTTEIIIMCLGGL